VVWLFRAGIARDRVRAICGNIVKGTFLGLIFLGPKKNTSMRVLVLIAKVSTGLLSLQATRRPPWGSHLLGQFRVC